MSFLHFHIIPTTFCPEKCPYCINSSKKFEEIEFNDYLLFLKKLHELQNSYKLILEFNGGEFTLSKNLYQYFEKLNSLNIFQLILTTNFNSCNKKYIKILNIIKDFNIQTIEFFVTFHFNKDKKFLNKIKEFLELTKEYNYIFTINLIKGLPLIENNWNKYFNEINELKNFDKRLNINYSKYIEKSNIKQGKTYNKENKKLCKGGIYYFLGKYISDACRNQKYSIIDFKPNHNLIYCDKTCPNQDFSLKIFKPRFLKKR